MNEDDGRTFLSRWSRRKIAARQAERAAPEQGVAEQPRAEVATARAGEAGGAPPAEAAPALPDPETLQGLQSEYRDFLQPAVDESLRRAALKKLFSDPHFNVMDGLDVYIDDYSRPDPIPQALLRSLNQARGLKLFEDEDRAADAAAQQRVVPPVADATAEPPGPVTESATDCLPATEVPVLPSSDPEEERKIG